jgi:hypothetical protein
MRLGSEGATASGGAYCYLGGAVMGSGGLMVSSHVVARLPNIRISDHFLVGAVGSIRKGGVPVCPGHAGAREVEWRSLSSSRG